MNVGKSINIALALKGWKRKDLAARLNVTQPTVSHMLARDTATGQMLKELAKAFDMKVSEFIALGEG